MLLLTRYLPLSITTLILLNPVHANPITLETRQPTPNPLEFLNLNASAIAPSPGSLSLSPTAGGKCGAALLGDGLVFPNAAIVRSAAGYIECQRRLVFKSVPVGFAFSVLAVEVGGLLELERGSVLEEVTVDIGYLPSSASTSTVQTDTATTSSPYGRFGAGHSGIFNLTMNLEPASPRMTRARTSCATVDKQPEMVLNLWVSLAHEQIDVDDSVMHKGSVSDLSVGLVVMWEKCGS